VTDAQPAATPARAPLLVVRDLDAYYGPAHVLQGVNFEMAEGSLAIIGRNGMGKTTLCAAIMGIRPPNATGSIKFQGRELCGRASFKIAGSGLGYVPQGRRLFPSLTVDEHLRMVSHRSGRDGARRWTAKDVYELFPRLGERRRNGGAQLSGGEQQMLAIGRALLTNPRLLLMDEPSEGLAPTVIESLIETFKQLEREGLAILLIEQNLGVATALAERQLVMVAGAIAAETTATEILDNPDEQRRFLGVEPYSER
jgi:branched-chain amino acid transport system ATP-binding protein